MTDLWITRRCWEDLEKLEDSAVVSVLERFQQRRGLNPLSGETMSGIAGIRKLHGDPGGGQSIRAVTWFDRGLDVCWLLAAGMHKNFYSGVLALYEAKKLFPNVADLADFAADAPQRLMRRVLRNARPVLHEALANPGKDILLTHTPPPRAYFRVENDRLWVCRTLHGHAGSLLTAKQVVAFRVAVFGTEHNELADPPWLDVTPWHSMYIVGPVPDPTKWPPLPQL